jgi:hypothetical protein
LGATQQLNLKIGDIPMASRSVFANIPEGVEFVFHSLPIVKGESQVDYERLLHSLVEMIDPQNVMEWVLLKNLLDLIWEERRYMKAKAAITSMTVKEALRLILESILPADLAERTWAVKKYAEDWFKGDEERLAVLKLMEPYGLSEDSVVAQALTLRLPEIEKLEQVLRQVRLGKAATTRELEYLRVNSMWLTKEIARITNEGMQTIAGQAQVLSSGVAMLEQPARAQEEDMKPNDL